MEVEVIIMDMGKKSSFNDLQCETSSDASHETAGDTMNYQEIVDLIQKLDLETFALIRSLLLKLTAEDKEQ